MSEAAVGAEEGFEHHEAPVQIESAILSCSKGCQPGRKNETGKKAHDEDLHTQISKTCERKKPFGELAQSEDKQEAVQSSANARGRRSCGENAPSCMTEYGQKTLNANMLGSDGKDRALRMIMIRAVRRKRCRASTRGWTPECCAFELKSAL